MTRKQAFSDKAIRSLVAGKLSDPVIPGLSITARGGGWSWGYHRRVHGTATTVRLTLGAYPAHSIDDARAWAARLNADVERGTDPRVALQAVKAAPVAQMTLREAWALYWSDTVRGTRRVLKPRTLADKRAMWVRDIEPVLAARALPSITPDDLWALVERKGDDAPVRANRLAAEIKVIWSWFVSRPGQRAGIALSADASLTLNGKHYVESTGRTRVLSDEEVALFLRAVAAESPSHRRALTLMLLTGCRFAEATEAPLSEYRDGLWTIPAQRTKNGKPHAIALGQWGRELFGEVDNELWLCPNARGTGIIEQRHWYRVRDRVHKRMEMLAERPLARWSFHDLRRTMRSNTFRLGIAYEVAEAMLNHAKQGLERRYDVSNFSVHARGFFHMGEALARDVLRV